MVCISLMEWETLHWTLLLQDNETFLRAHKFPAVERVMMMLLVVLGLGLVTASPNCSYSPSEDSLKCSVTQLHSVKTIHRQTPGNKIQTGFQSSLINFILFQNFSSYLGRVLTISPGPFSSLELSCSEKYPGHNTHVLTNAMLTGLDKITRIDINSCDNLHINTAAFQVFSELRAPLYPGFKGRI